MPCHLERHFKLFALDALSVTDLTDQARRRGAAVYLIERRLHDDSIEPLVTLSGSMLHPRPLTTPNAQTDI